jgi:hypothetical protein
MQRGKEGERIEKTGGFKEDERGMKIMRACEEAEGEKEPP